MSKDKSDKTGTAFFVVSFIFTAIFFLVVIGINPGPIDKPGFDVPVQFSRAEALGRVVSWMEVVDENINYGKELYAVNCVFCHAAGGQDRIVEKSDPLPYRDMYNIIVEGYQGVHVFSHFPQRERLALVAYLQSLRPGNVKVDSDANYYLEER